MTKLLFWLLFFFIHVVSFANSPFRLKITNRYDFNYSKTWKCKINDKTIPLDWNKRFLSTDFSNHLLIVGTNTFSFDSRIDCSDSRKNYSEKRTFLFSLYRDGFLIKKQNIDDIKYCNKKTTTSNRFNLSLETIDPELYQEIQDYEAALAVSYQLHDKKERELTRDLNNEASKFEKELESLYNKYEKMLSSSFEDLGENDSILNIFNLQSLYERLQDKVTQIKEDLEAKDKNVSNSLKIMETRLNSKLKSYYKGKDVSDIISSSETIVDLSHDDNYSYAKISKIISDECKIWEKNLKQNEKNILDFYKIAYAFIYQTKSDRIDFSENGLGRQAFIELESCTQKINKVIYTILDENLWPKNSGIPKETRNYIDNEIKTYDPETSERMKLEMIQWGHVLSPEERKSLAAINAIGKLIGSFFNQTMVIFNEIVEIKTQVDKVLEESLVAAKIGACETASFAPMIGDFRDFYEFYEGKDYCSGENLSLSERAITTFGLIIGKGSWWRKAAAAIGIVSVAKVSKTVVDSARKFWQKVGKNKTFQFPKKADDLLKDLPRDAKGRIYTSDKIRIRPEKHGLKPGETYNPRHHGEHFHVEIRKDSTKSWNNKNNVIKVKPEDYKPGDGTGFLPGELFPGL